jgi:hypothetical protein
MRENDGGGMNVTKVHCKHIRKCHNEASVQLMYANRNGFFKRIEHCKKTFYFSVLDLLIFPWVTTWLLRLYSSHTGLLTVFPINQFLLAFALCSTWNVHLSQGHLQLKFSPG